MLALLLLWVLCSFSPLACRSMLLVQNAADPKGIALPVGRPAAEGQLPTTEPVPSALRRAGSKAARVWVKSTLRRESQPSAPAESARPLQHPCQLGLANQSLPFWDRNRANEATRVVQEAKDGCRWETADYTGFSQFNLSWDISALCSILDAPQHALLAKCTWGMRGEYPRGSNHPEMGPNTMHMDMPKCLVLLPSTERDRWGPQEHDS